MVRLRFYLITLLLFTGISLNIERLDFGTIENVINLASFLYLLIGMAVLSTIMIPREWNISTRMILMFWLLIYFVIKIALRENHPLFGGIYTYLMIVEIFFLVSLIIFTQKVMENLNELEETVANITLEDLSERVINLDEAANEVRKEFTRSRRYKHPLGVVVIKVDHENNEEKFDKLSKDVLKLMMSRYTMGNFVRELDKEIRRPDLILEQHGDNRIILLLPEANMEAVEAVSKNVQRIALEKVGAKVPIGIATFPNDAITFEDLVLHAERMMSVAEENVIDGNRVSEVDA